MRVIERSDLVARTVLIVTGDHETLDPEQRKKICPHPVFLIMFFNEEERRVFDSPLQTIRTRSLIRRLLDGSLRNIDDVERFFKMASGG